MKDEGFVLVAMTGGAGRECMKGTSRQTPDHVPSRACSDHEQESFVNDPASGWRMACDVCHRDFDVAVTLFAAVNGRVICSGCWHRSGSPFPRRQAS